MFREDSKLTRKVSKNVKRSAEGKRRIVVKAGTNVLTGGSDGIDLRVMKPLVDQISRLKHDGNEILIVTSGAVAAGREVLGKPEPRRDIPYRQMLAAVGQSRLMNTYQEMFSEHNVVLAQALLTRNDIDDWQGYLNVRDTLLSLLSMGVIPVINENDVVNTEELGAEVFGDNDTLSALVSNLVDADLLIMLTDIDGLYTSDPSIDTDAGFIPIVNEDNLNQIMDILGTKETLHSWSRGGIKTKIEAAMLATRWGVEVVIASGLHPDVLYRVVNGDSEGTIFKPSGNKMESRKRWFLSGVSARGKIMVDEGAAEALRKTGSLLPVGVQEVSGGFQRRDVVLIVDSQGRSVAYGITNYSVQDVDLIKGLRSSSIEGKLGHEYGAEIVHRNNLVML